MPSKLVQDHFFNPRNVGDLGNRGYCGRAGSLSCGAVVQVSISVDEAQTIREIKFKAAGCSVLVAAASLLTETVEGNTTGAVAALAQSTRQPELTYLLSEEGADRAHCASLASEALLSAITCYSDSVRHEWEGDEALICTCFCVSERTIETEIQRSGLSTVKEVIKGCRAGGGCRSCWPLIEDMLRRDTDFSL
jgi:NifU-like protein